MKRTGSFKLNGKPNDLFDRILNDPVFGLTEEELKAVSDPIRFTGMAVQQTDRFLSEYVKPVLDQNQDSLGQEAVVSV